MGSTLLHNVPPQIFLSFLHLTQNGTQFKIFGQKILDYDRLNALLFLYYFRMIERFANFSEWYSGFLF